MKRPVADLRPARCEACRCVAPHLAASVNAPTALGAAARQTLLAARAEGRGRQDWTAVYETVCALAALAPRAGTSKG